MADGKDDHIQVSDAPNALDIEALDDRIDAFNAALTGIHDGRLLSIVLKTAAGELYAGLHGHTWGGCCEIKTLWIAESWRRQGLGKRLLQAAENEAVRRGCGIVVLSSHSFQAPEFYERQGYRRVATVDGYPTGYSYILLVKSLPGRTSSSDG